MPFCHRYTGLLVGFPKSVSMHRIYAQGCHMIVHDCCKQDPTVVILHIDQSLSGFFKRCWQVSGVFSLLCVTSMTVAEKNDVVKVAIVGADSHQSAMSSVCFPFPLEQGTRLEGVCPWGGSAAFSYSAEYIYIVHGGLVRADDHLCSTDDPLQWFPRTHGGVAAPRCDCAAVDAFKGSSAGWRLGLAFRSSLTSCSLFGAVFTVFAAFFNPSWSSEGQKSCGLYYRAQSCWRRREHGVIGKLGWGGLFLYNQNDYKEKEHSPRQETSFSVYLSVFKAAPVPP